ncbi:MAG: Ig-like domain-containing protein [Acidimicrobiales bacterium]
MVRALATVVIAAVGSLVGVAPAFAGGGSTPTFTQTSTSLNPAYYGSLFDITGFVDTSTGGTVTTGTMTFTVGSTSFGPVPVNLYGIAQVTLSDLAVGSYSVVAVYNGTSTYASSESSSFTQIIVSNPTTTALSASRSTALYAQAVTFTAQISTTTGTSLYPSGTVTFTDGSTTLGTSAVSGSGTATFTTDALPLGSQTIAASYGGDQGFEASTSPAVTVDVPVASTTTALSGAPSPSLFGQQVSFTATVQPTDGGGTMAFTSGGSPIDGCGAVALSATSAANAYDATCATTSLAVGSDKVTATYSGATGYLKSSANVTQVVTRAPTALSATPALLSLSPFDPYLFTLHATLTSKVLNAPLAGEPVVFSAGGSQLCSATTDASGEASCSPLPTSAPALAALVLAQGYQVTYAGDSDYLPSTASAGLISN